MKPLPGLWTILVLLTVALSPSMGLATIISIPPPVGSVHLVEAFPQLIDNESFRPGEAPSVQLWHQAMSSLHPWHSLLRAQASAGAMLTSLLTVADQEFAALFPGSVRDDEASNREVTTVSVPLPAAMWLFGGGLTALVGLLRRKGASTNNATPSGDERDRWDGVVRTQIESVNHRTIGIRRDDPHGCFVAFDDS